MSTGSFHPAAWPAHGQVGYLQIPCRDLRESGDFYADVFGWSVDSEHGSFTAPGMIGQFTAERSPAADNAGTLVWICADTLGQTLQRVADRGGAVRSQPWLDGGERWLAEVDDPAGNRIGVVVPARNGQPQTLLAVRDVEASSRWYQQLLALTSDHGGPEYERLLADGVLVLQLHRLDVGHHHGPIADADRDVGNGVLVWFGEVSDFDGVVARAEKLDAPIVRPVHRNPPEGHGNGPGHREIWLRDPDGYTVVAASPDGEAFEPA
jgi:predicted enzyme related to lactoylglutathione lyase